MASCNESEIFTLMLNKSTYFKIFDYCAKDLSRYGCRKA